MKMMLWDINRYMIYAARSGRGASGTIGAPVAQVNWELKDGADTARRLAVSWNACAQFPSSLLEEDIVEQMYAALRDLVDEMDETDDRPQAQRARDVLSLIGTCQHCGERFYRETREQEFCNNDCQHAAELVEKWDAK